MSSERSAADRRTFIGSMLAVLPVASLSNGAIQAEVHAGESGLIIREKQPLNLEYPFNTLDGPIVATNQFFVRTHFPVPAIDVKDWKLVVDGEVDHELTLNYEDLLQLPSKSMPVLLECAGNGRAQLVPKAKGLLWNNGAVGAAEWTGVLLSTVLKKAGIKATAVDIVLQGADKGEIIDDPKSPGVINFERSLPVEKAMQPEVLLAYKMNGKDLTPEHGFPIRAIVGGWYGVASIKWLSRITVTSKPFNGFWQTLEYSYWRRDNGRPTLKPVTAIQIKSQIARPAHYEEVPANESYRVFGAAWGGESPVTKVELSVDRGETWTATKLLGEARPFTWRLWEYAWDVPKTTGRHQIMSRATAADGQTQPTQHDKDKRNYMINHSIPIDIHVV